MPTGFRSYRICFVLLRLLKANSPYIDVNNFVFGSGDWLASIGDDRRDVRPVPSSI
jgi:hypothetical protein